jgi:hypothetical protein
MLAYRITGSKSAPSRAWAAAAVQGSSRLLLALRTEARRRRRLRRLHLFPVGRLRAIAAADWDILERVALRE